MNDFCHSTAKIAAWNLNGFFKIPAKRLKLQVEGLALLDAEVVVLVEINPLDALEKLKKGLAKKGCTYESSIIPQANKLNIGVLFKKGVTVKNPRLMDGSDLGDNKKRKAFMVDIKVGKFDFLLIAVHLKSSRGANAQAIRDEQAKVIGSFIKDLRKKKPREDILLVVDFRSSHEFMQPAGFAAFVLPIPAL